MRIDKISHIVFITSVNANLNRLGSYLNYRMQQKSDKQTLEEKTLRYNLHCLFKTNTKNDLLPFGSIQVVLQTIQYLQILRYSIDYYTPTWFGTAIPIFSYLDVSFYFKFAPKESQFSVLLFAIVFMNTYLLIQLLLYVFRDRVSNPILNFRRLFFLITKNLFFLPMLNIEIGAFRISQAPFSFALLETDNRTLYQILAAASFNIFFFFLIAQSYLNFSFLKRKTINSFQRLKKSAYTPTCLLIYFALNEAMVVSQTNFASLLILNVSTILLLVLFTYKNQHLVQSMRLLEFGLLSISMLGCLTVDISMAFYANFNVFLFFIMALFMAAAVYNLKIYSIEYEVQNINKWPTAEIIIKYNNNLRYYLSRRDEYLFKASIFGYMEIHRHKCEHDDCPSRGLLSEIEKKSIELQTDKDYKEEFIRCQNIVKHIYHDGYKDTQVNGQLQLENAIFLYEKGQRQIALKTLLQVHFENLSADKYYQYSYLKELIHREMCEEPDVKFLDLVSELRVKHQQEVISQKMQKAGLINLQFWTTLNQDHPDFSKLTEQALERVKIRQSIRESYAIISSIASSEKVTNLYVQYLQAIQNDEEMFTAILQQIREQYDLGSKIVLQDWANTSQAIIVVSIEAGTFGNIIDINSSCAMLLGYQKYEMISHSIKMLLHEDLGADIEHLLNKNHLEETYFMVHKSGYLIKTKCRSQNYNSMDTGMATVISLQVELTPSTCYFVINKHSQKIIGVSSTAISITGLQRKVFDDQVLVSTFFKHSIKEMANLAIESSKTYFLSDLIEEKFEQEMQDYKLKTYRLSYGEYDNCNAVALHSVFPPLLNPKASRQEPQLPAQTFEFQIQATLSTFKFYGCNNSHESYVSQFSQLSYAESLKRGPTVRNYGSGITTLRLKDSIIQVIEEGDREEVDGIKRRDSQTSAQFLDLPQKQQEQIFTSRTAFTQFIQSFSFGYSMLVVMGLAKLFFFGCYLFGYQLMKAQNNTITTLSQQLIYNNLMTGTMTKQLALSKSILQMRAGQFHQNVPNFVQEMKDNLKYATQVRFLGGQQYNLTVLMGAVNLTFLSHEYYLSFLDNGNIIKNAISNATTQEQVLQVFGSAQNTALNYLLNNCAITKEEMLARSKFLQKSLKDEIIWYQKQDILIMIIGMVSIMSVTMIKIITTCRIDKQRHKIFDIFLDVTQVQIQTFSSKTEKFLTALHEQDVNREIDVDEEVQNTRKQSSSTFTKKKRYKNVDFFTGIVVIYILAALLYSGYFIHTFVLSSASLKFSQNSTRYQFMTSGADYTLYTGLSQLKTAALNSAPLPTFWSNTFLSYYYDYFNLHYETYGHLQAFHQFFTDIQMTDICNGTQTQYGSTKILQSCQVPHLYPNGSYLFFTDLALTTQALHNQSSLTNQLHISYQVVSKAHRKLSESATLAQRDNQNDVHQQLTLALVLWVCVLAVMSVLALGILALSFVRDLNKTKNILTILPLSVAKGLPKMTQYCSAILQSKRCFS